MLPRNGCFLLFVMLSMTVCFAVKPEKSTATDDDEKGKLVDISQLQNKFEHLAHTTSRPTRPTYPTYPTSRPTSGYPKPYPPPPPPPPPIYWPPYPPPYPYPHPPKPYPTRPYPTKPYPTEPTTRPPRPPRRSPEIRRLCREFSTENLLVCSRACRLAPNATICEPVCSLTAAVDDPYCSLACVADPTAAGCEEPEPVTAPADCPPAEGETDSQCNLFCLYQQEYDEANLEDWCPDLIGTPPSMRYPFSANPFSRRRPGSLTSYELSQLFG